jgi:hypothetical protein
MMKGRRALPSPRFYDEYNSRDEKKEKEKLGTVHALVLIHLLSPLTLVLSNSTARPPSVAAPCWCNVAFQLTALQTTFIASVRAKGRTASTSAPRASSQAGPKASPGRLWPLLVRAGARG